MEDIVLIGSRGLNHYLKDLMPPTTDYDFVATQSGALKWLSTLPSTLKFDKVEYKYDRDLHNADIEHDLSKWKHMDGSLALEIYRTQLKDIQGITKIIGHTDSLKFEIEIAEKGSSGELILQYTKLGGHPHAPIVVGGVPHAVASIAVLEAIKTSHIIFPFNWRKHIESLMLMRELIGREDNESVVCRTPELEKLIIHRRLEHYLRLGVPGSNINLDKMNEDFLENENVLYIDKYIKHDDIHLRLMPSGDNPSYFDLRTDKNKAMMSKKLFDKAPFKVKLNCVREEAMVIALERYLLPNREIDYQTAYSKALMRICTTLTKGWFREFAINVYHKVKKLKRDLTQIKNDIMKEYEEKKIEDIKKIEEDIKKIEDKKQIKKNQMSKETIINLSGSSGIDFRVEHLFPIVFQDEDELKLARDMADATDRLYDRELIYRCIFEGLNIVFSANTEYEYENGGWCANYNTWNAYVAATTWEDYVKNQCDSEFMTSSYYVASRRKALDEICLSFTMCMSADDSFSTRSSIDNLEVKDLNYLSTMSSNPLITGDFLMKFILCISYPPKFDANGGWHLEKSDIHFLYPIWANEILRKNTPNTPFLGNGFST